MTSTMQRVKNPTLPTWDEWEKAMTPLGKHGIEPLIWRLHDFEQAYLDSAALPTSFEDVGRLWVAAAYLRMDGETLIGFADEIEKLLHTVDMVRSNA